MGAADHRRGDVVTFVSYAQNYEDVMLWRALRDVERGFYVDVGAQDAIDDSVTRAFHDRGWRGINVEPVARWHARLRQDRPDDINLPVLVADAPGAATLYEVADSGLSTMDAALAAQHAREGRQVTAREVAVTTLDAILAEHAPPVIHFLKIDVEGAEAAVLRGLSLQRYRPWVLLVESRAPNSDVETHAEWEPGVLQAGYRYVYQDGLNRFYVAEEQAQRAAAFSSPPNVLDGFMRHGEWDVRHRYAELQVEADDRNRRIDILGATVAQRDEQLTQWQARAAELSEQAERATEHAERLHAGLMTAQAQLSSLESRLMATQAELSLVQAHLDERQALLAQILGSRSWRLTRPLRVLTRLLEHGPGELIAFLLRRTPQPADPARDAAIAEIQATAEEPLSEEAESALQHMDAARGSGDAG